MSKPMVSIPREEYTALQDKVSELTDANALLDKHVENLRCVVTRDANEILALKLDLSFAKAQMDTLYVTPASGIKFDGVAAVQAAAPAAAAEKPLGAPPAASSPKEPLGAPPAADSAATAGNGIFKAIRGLMGLGGAGAAGPPAAPPPPGCLKNYKSTTKTVIDAGAAAGGPAKDKLQRPKEPNTTATPSFMAEMAAKQALRAQNGAANNAVDCREKQLEAVKQADDAAAITAAAARKTRVDSMVGLEAARKSAKAGTPKQQAEAEAQEQAQNKTVRRGLAKFASAREGPVEADDFSSDSGGEDDEKNKETVQTPTVASSKRASTSFQRRMLKNAVAAAAAGAGPEAVAPTVSAAPEAVAPTVSAAPEAAPTASAAPEAAAPTASAAPEAAAPTASADPEAAPADDSDLM